MPDVQPLKATKMPMFLASKPVTFADVSLIIHDW